MWKALLFRCGNDKGINKMIENFVPYLREIGLTQTAIDRAEQLVAEINTMLPAELERIYCNDTIEAAGIRSYSNLWLFTSSYISEIKQFMTSKQFDIIHKDSRFNYIDVTYDNWDGVGTTNDASRMIVNVMASPMQIRLFAVRNNCPHLLSILRDKFFGHLTPVSGEARGHI